MFKYTVLLLTVIIFISCKKNSDESNAPQNKEPICKVIKTIGNYSNGGRDTAFYFYSDTLLNEIKISYYSSGYNGGKSSWKFSYSNKRISRIDISFDNVPSEKELRTFNYNSTGMLQKIQNFEITNADTSWKSVTQYEYFGDTIIKAKVDQVLTLSGYIFPTEVYTFTIEKGNVIAVTTRTGYTELVAYDNKPNYFQKIFGKDNFFLPSYIPEDVPNMMPFLYSKNNVIQLGSYFTITYDESPEKNINNLYWNGSLNESYFYNCK